MKKPLSINYNYETGMATICYLGTNSPPFVSEPHMEMIEREFDITDDAVMEAHEFMLKQASEGIGQLGDSLKEGEEGAEAA